MWKHKNVDDIFQMGIEKVDVVKADSMMVT